MREMHRENQERDRSIRHTVRNDKMAAEEAAVKKKRRIKKKKRKTKKKKRRTKKIILGSLSRRFGRWRSVESLDFYPPLVLDHSGTNTIRILEQGTV